MNNTLTVEKLFSGRLLRVPDYQRGYAWDKKNWTDFIEDLDLLPRGKHHYTGTVVLVRVTKPPAGVAVSRIAPGKHSAIRRGSPPIHRPIAR